MKDQVRDPKESFSAFTVVKQTFFDPGLKEPLKRFDETFSGEGIVLDRLRAERPDLDWFVAPTPERVYSINDNPNSCRRIAGQIGLCIFAALVGFSLTVLVLTGGH